jgi:hypothetical protein
MAETKLATFKIQSDRWDAFLDKTSEQGTNASALLKLFIDRYLDGSIDLKQPQAPSNIEAVLDEYLEPIKGELAELRSRMETLSLGKPRFQIPTRAMPVKK